MTLPSSSHWACRLPSLARRAIWSIAWCAPAFVGERRLHPTPFRYTHELLWWLVVNSPPTVAEVTLTPAAGAWAANPAASLPGGCSAGAAIPAPFLAPTSCACPGTSIGAGAPPAELGVAVSRGALGAP